MNSPKQKYIERIRSQSAYPTFRSLIRIIAILFYVLGALAILGGLAGIANQGSSGILALFGGIISGIICIVVGQVTQETASILADIADSITDLNCRYEQK
jgi:hypothetical protein